jgi:hypothetical protein
MANEGQTSSDWISPSSFLTFSSDQDAITVSDEGVVTLAANYYDAVTLTATDSCGSGVSGTSDVYANLEAETYDVDMGATTGPAFGTVTAGDTFDVAVRIQGSDDDDVTAFQIIVTFDSSVVKVASDSDCAQGNGWSATFECTTNDPTDEVLLIGSCGLSPSSDCASTGLLTVATITFTAVASGASDIAGEIVKIKDDTATVTGVDIFAGADVLAVSAARRRLTLETRPVTSAAAARAAASRAVLTETTAAAKTVTALETAGGAATELPSLAGAATDYLKSAWSWFAKPRSDASAPPRRLTEVAEEAGDREKESELGLQLTKDLAALAERFALPAEGTTTRRHHDTLVYDTNETHGTEDLATPLQHFFCFCVWKSLRLNLF